MQIILKCYQYPDFVDQWLEYAIVDIGPEFFKMAKQRRAMLDAGIAQDDQLYELYFWDYRPEFFKRFHFERGDEDDEEGDLFCSILMANGEPLLDERWEDEGYCELFEGFTIPEKWIEAADCVQMVVARRGIMWFAYPKHTDVHVTTASISWDDLEHWEKEA
jgi:hypothetical protein